MDKCCDLLTRGEKEIILHGLGAAIQRCCNLALQLETLFSGTCQIEVNTGTVNLIGKFIHICLWFPNFMKWKLVLLHWSLYFVSTEWDWAENDWLCCARLGKAGLSWVREREKDIV